MSITWVEALGVVAFITNVWGNLMLANMNKTGWIVRWVTNCLWMVHAFHTRGGWPLLLNHAVFFYINIDGWMKWEKAQRLAEANKRLVPIDYDRGVK